MSASLKVHERLAIVEQKVSHVEAELAKVSRKVDEMHAILLQARGVRWAVIAVSGVVLGALYMLWFAQRFLFGAAKAPHLPLTDLGLREKVILATIVVAVFWLGLFPAEAMRKSELAAQQFQQLVAADRTGTRTAARVEGARGAPGATAAPAAKVHSTSTR